MSAKDKNKVKIEFIGNNATDVTGSATLISFEGRKILFECGGIQQGRTIYENYRLNRHFLQKIKAKEIDMIIIGHNHYDHLGQIPALIQQNPNIRIIAPAHSSNIMKEMWLDSAFISERDCEVLENQYPERHFEPYYGVADVERSFNCIEEVGFDEIVPVDSDVSLRFTNAGHIYASAQCELFIKVNNHVKKILFTSDLGNTMIEDKKPFVDKFKPVSSANIAIVETTYGSRENIKLTKKIIEKDMEKIQSVIEQFCVQNHRRVLFPVFSLDKCPNVLWLIYQMFKDREDFTSKVIIDSPLTNRLLDVYSQELEGDAKEKFDEMMRWDKILRIVSPEQSKYAIENYKNCIILSSSGMLNQGRSVKWLQSLLPESGDCILMTGYCGENTLGWKIRNCSDQKTISINGKQIRNRCQIVNIRSMSSHMQREQLLSYYKTINAEKIYLVHGGMDGKVQFAQDLKEEIANCSKTTKVSVVNNSTTISI